MCGGSYSAFSKQLRVALRTCLRGYTQCPSGGSVMCPNTAAETQSAVLTTTRIGSFCRSRWFFSVRPTDVLVGIPIVVVRLDNSRLDRVLERSADGSRSKNSRFRKNKEKDGGGKKKDSPRTNKS